MQKPIKFLYAALIITIIGGGFTLWIIKATKNESSNKLSQIQNISNENNPEIYTCLISLEKDEDGSYQQATCDLETITKGAQFIVDIGHGTKLLFTSTKDIVDPSKSVFDDDYPYPWTYTVMNDISSKIHTINFNTISDMGFHIGTFSFRDWNFDGYLDLIDAPMCGNGQNCYSDLYFFDQKTGDFIKSENGVGGDSSSLDIKNRIWFEHSRDASSDDYSSIRKFINGKWVLVESHSSYTSGDSYDKCTFKDGAMIKGKWVEKTETVPFDGEYRCSSYGPSYSLETDVK